MRGKVLLVAEGEVGTCCWWLNAIPCCLLQPKSTKGTKFEHEIELLDDHHLQQGHHKATLHNISWAKVLAIVRFKWKQPYIPSLL
jgi:hypothetical protein